MPSPHFPWMQALLLALALLTGGCRTKTRDLPEVPKTEKKKKTKGAKGSKRAKAAVNDEDAGEGVGPKVMGYQYFFRYSYGLLDGEYADEQENEAIGRESSLTGVTTKGARHILEHYPVVYDNFPKSQYGYALLEFRSETTNRDFWEKRQTLVALMGFVLPRWRLLAPVIGIHTEFNQIDMGDADAPEVSKSDIRATVVGLNFRQKVWGTGDWYAAYYAGRLHLLNIAQASTGWEAEFGLGSSFQVWLLRADATIGYMEQRYRGNRPAGEEETGNLKVSSRYQATYLMMSLWI